tara:strand:+ start:6551 stop:6661 length:111 start_codon:yes stop_codon:yes gene_type:complete
VGKVNDQRNTDVIENDWIKQLGIVVVGKISSCKEWN